MHAEISDDDTIVYEQWLASDRRSGAQRTDGTRSFVDYVSKRQWTHEVGSSTVYITAAPEPLSYGDTNLLSKLLRVLNDPAGPPQFPFGVGELVSKAERQVKDGDKNWLEIELILRVGANSRGAPSKVQIRVDPETKLPSSLTMTGDETHMTATFDYPTVGPKDVFDLGVSRDSKLVDRTRLPNDVLQVMNGLKSGRRDFDNYVALVVQERILPTSHFPKSTVWRVYRKGDKWRIDRTVGETPVPKDADVSWWKLHDKELVFLPSIVCDGQAYWAYYLNDDWRPGDKVPAPGTRSEFGQTVGANPLMGSNADPIIPHWCQLLLPEQAGRQTTGVGAPTPDPGRKFVVDHQPESGPEQTILFRILDTQDEEQSDLARMWIDPQQGFLAKQFNLRVNGGGREGNAVWIQKHSVESVAKSPSGRFFPAQTRNVTRGDTHEVVRRFIVDFNTELPASVFQPPHDPP